MSDPDPKIEQPADPAAKAKIKLYFKKPHNHNGVQYKQGDVGMFTQADADAIRQYGSADTFANPGVQAP